MTSSEFNNSKIGALQLAVELGLKNVDLQFESSSKTGFLGEVFKLKIIGERNGKKETVSVIVKHVPLTEYHESLRIYEYYHCEAMTYNSIFPIFDQIQTEAGVEKKFKHIKAYKTVLERRKESIFMEDLTDKGFKNAITGRILDLDHARLFLLELGKFHALSFAMKQRDPHEFDEQTKTTRNVLFEDFKDIEILALNSIKHAAEVLENDECRQKFSELEAESTYLINTMVKDEKNGPNVVITHGDAWTNNALYKYDEDKIQEVLLLDWQTINRCSPTIDVLFFLLVSVDPEVRSAHFQELLNTYYRSLSSYLRELKCDSEELYSQHVYNEELKKFTKLAVIQWLIMLPVFTNTNEEFDKNQEKQGSKGASALLGSPIRSDIFIKQVRGGMRDLIVHGLI